MVSLDIDRGAEILHALGRAKVKVGVAPWAFLSEYEDWRLVLAARQFDALDLMEAYGLLHDSLAPAGFTVRNTPPIMILRMSDPLIRDLRRLFAKTKGVEGMRLGGQMFGDRFGRRRGRLPDFVAEQNWHWFEWHCSTPPQSPNLSPAYRPCEESRSNSAGRSPCADRRRTARASPHSSKSSPAR